MRRLTLSFGITLLLLLGSMSSLRGDQMELEAIRGEELTVYLMTMGPGDYVWERFGHNAIRIRDDLRGTDIAYNYGMFSFDQENFLLRFIRGENDYWMEAVDTRLMANAYIQANRSVWMQELDFTPAQRADLRDFLEWNALPENRTYRYDYYRDNCSTRVRDAINRALGGQIQERTSGLSSGSTYREHTRALTAVDPPIYAGLMLALGPGVDREISVWEEMFLPMQLMRHISGLSVDDGSGGRKPLVAAEQAVFLADRIDAGTLPGSRSLPLALLGLGIGALIIVAGRKSRESGVARVLFTSIGAGWAIVAGLLGLVVLGLWMFTAHEAAHRNENLFFVSPLLVPVAVLLPVSFGRSGKGLRAAQAFLLIVAGFSLVGLAFQALPISTQVNGEVMALALPINLALAFAVWERGRSSPGIHGNDGVVRARRETPAGASP